MKYSGQMHAGWPSPAEEELVDTLSLDDYLGHPDPQCIVRVTSDAMIDGGIHPGDLVMIKRDKKPRFGSIVFVYLDGEWCFRFFEKQNGQIVLMPRNKKYPPFFPKEEIKIKGVVSVVMRKYY